MAKEIKDENGNTYVQKKPFYKKWWFWLIIVILVIIGFASAGSGSSNSNSSSNQSKTTAVKKSKTAKKPAKVANTTITDKDTNASNDDKVPSENKAALEKAKTYSSLMHLSRQGIYDQLTSEAGEKFPATAAQYAVDHLKVDYNANALAKAKDYRKQQNMSDNELREQLTSDAGEKFTPQEADYAIQHLND